MSSTPAERLTDSLYGLGWAGVRRLPEPVAAALGRSIADTAWRQRGKGVRRLEANLARVVPGASSERLRELSQAGMRSYLRYWMESFRLPAWQEPHIRDNVHIHELRRLTDGIASDRGVILALPHLANWDLAGAYVTTVLKTPFSTVVERLKPESLFDRFVAYREGLGMEVLPHSGGSAFGTLARRLRDGGLVCLVADRDLSSSGVEVDFFGERTRMPAGPALLAQQTGALLLPVTLWYEEPPRMEGMVHPPVEVPSRGTREEKTSAMTQAVADRFAEGIAGHPEDWHMLQRLWLSDLPVREGAGEPHGGTGDGPAADSAPVATEGDGPAANGPAGSGTSGSGPANSGPANCGTSGDGTAGAAGSDAEAAHVDERASGRRTAPGEDRER
ncbi:phosphatidylinositol mannoside acyltransferase [Streptomyces marispadix]|uniref:Phosphatidylinositol mannoside acyltransferase n=1 Tax=Streptomyces marispadix TaxID=2922868 RepID=A0ABS9SSG4_9ACTN|nr:phosphatidylinositol mannoside acyltransferase [Streptomyces marispadix]MCH6159206.1 phosphatidylinositol mannoside acyltransferase [Streptomyces marispadix]